MIKLRENENVEDIIDKIVDMFVNDSNLNVIKIQMDSVILKLTRFDIEAYLNFSIPGLRDAYLTFLLYRQMCMLFEQPDFLVSELEHFYTQVNENAVNNYLSNFVGNIPANA